MPIEMNKIKKLRKDVGSKTLSENQIGQNIDYFKAYCLGLHLALSLNLRPGGRE